MGRRRIAERVAFGVRSFWPCAWLVLTFAGSQAEDPKWKVAAVRRLAHFIKLLRKEYGRKLEYAATYELTRRGRLHINLIIGPWTFISQKRLQILWGARVSVALVKDASLIGREAAKSYFPESLGTYLSKLDQAVPVEWGRRCSFSRVWPRLPRGGLPRVGSISWQYCRVEDRISFYAGEFEEKFVEVEAGEYAYKGEVCFCFVKDSLG